MKRGLKCFLSLACCLSTHLFSQTGDAYIQGIYCETPDYEIDAYYEPQNDVGNYYSVPSYGYAFNPPFYDVKNWCGISGDLEYLYWRPDLRLNVAGVQRSPNTTQNPTVDVKRLKFDWDSGWRLGFGYQFPCDGWKCSLIWTKFHTLSHDAYLNLNETTGVNQANFIVPFLLPLSNLGDAATAQMKNEAHVNYNDLSLLLSREFLVGPHLSITPFTGLKALFDTNKYQFELTQNYLEAHSTTDTYKYRNKFTGVGVTGGLNTYWDLFCNIGLEAFTQVSLLFANSDVFIEAISESELISENLTYNFQEVSYTLDAGVFLRWSQQISCDQGLVSLRIGWEAHYLSDQNRTFYPTNVISSVVANVTPLLYIGDVKESPLTFQGLVIGLTLSM